MRSVICVCVLAQAAVWMTASNADGDIWTRYPGSPILTASSDTTRFDSGYVCDQRIVYDSDTSQYFMYYTGGTNTNGQPGYPPERNGESLGLATASSLSGPWTKYDSPNDRHALFAPGQPGDYDYDRNWGMGTILKTGPTTWQMWTLGDSDPSATHIARLGYATSNDGYHWTKYAGSGYGGSIFSDFSAGNGIENFAVVKEGNTYSAWYSLLYGNQIRYATSPNGIDWSIQGTVLSGPQFEYGLANVVKIDDTYYMSTTRGNLAGADIYTSTNKTNWTLLSDASLSPSAHGWDSARVYFPFLLPTSASDWCLIYTGANVADDKQAKIGYAFAGVPEPAAMTMLGTGLLTLLAWRGYAKRRAS